MLQILYITAFALLSLLAIANLIRSMAALARTEGRVAVRRDYYRSLHPELLDATGKPTREPLLVMKALDLDEARAQLDRMFEASPGNDS